MIAPIVAPMMKIAPKISALAVDMGEPKLSYTAMATTVKEPPNHIGVPAQ